MSEWQIPQNLMSVRTSRGPIARRWTSKAASGASGAGAPTARAVVVSRDAAVKVVSVMPVTLDAPRLVRGGLRAPPQRSLVSALDGWQRCELAQRRLGRRPLVRGGQQQRQARVRPQRRGFEDEIEV